MCTVTVCLYTNRETNLSSSRLCSDRFSSFLQKKLPSLIIPPPPPQCPHWRSQWLLGVVEEVRISYLVSCCAVLCCAVRCLDTARKRIEILPAQWSFWFACSNSRLVPTGPDDSASRGIVALVISLLAVNHEIRTCQGFLRYICSTVIKRENLIAHNAANALACRGWATSAKIVSLPIDFMWDEAALSSVALSQGNENCYGNACGKWIPGGWAIAFTT